MGVTAVVSKFLSPADPAAWWTGADGGLAYFAYATNYLIDLYPKRRAATTTYGSAAILG